MTSGFLLIDKPVDWTSHDVVGYIRTVIRQCAKTNPMSPIPKKTKVGHAGTLDPFATGLLIVGIGREATKRMDEFKALPKTYTTTMRVGATSDTYDKTGTVKPCHPNTLTHISREQIVSIMQSFLGEQTQIPPMYSAKKVNGKKLYELARQGIDIERTPHHITIFDIVLTDISDTTISFSCTVSPGTYIRTLVHDIGHTLGTGAYCETLRRTQIGPYRVEDAHPPSSVTPETITHLLRTL